MRLTPEREAAIRAKVAKGYGCCEWDLLQEIDALRAELKAALGALRGEDTGELGVYPNTLADERDRLREALEIIFETKRLFGGEMKELVDRFLSWSLPVSVCASHESMPHK